MTVNDPLDSRGRRAARHGQRRPGWMHRIALLTTVVVLPLGLASNTLATTQVTVKNPGGLVAAGPVDGANGFPTWYADSAGNRVEPCLDPDNPLCGLLPGDVPDPESPISFPDYFPEEFFYQLIDSSLTLPGGGKATLTLGLEAAFANGPAEEGEQVVFARTRVVLKGAPRSTTVTIKHPFGELTVDTDGTGAGRLVQDISPAVGNFEAALKGNFGPFLTWDPAVAPQAPAGFTGDPAVAHKVVGGLAGYNKFSVSGGGLALETDQFTISGKLATNTGVTADRAVINGGYLDVFATSKGSALQVDGITDSFATTPMTHDDGTDRHYARIALTGTGRPAQVTIRNLSDKPVSTAVVKTGDITVTQADYDGSTLTVAATAGSYPLTVAGLGTLESSEPKTWTVLSPPPAVSIKGTNGLTVVFPVRITGGPAMDPALPPVPPETDPGPINDNTPNNPASDPVAAIAPVSPTRLGTSVTLDGSASVGAASYAWTQVSGGPAATITGANTAKPIVSLKYFTSTTATAPSPTATPIVFQLVVTDGAGTASTPVVVEIPVKTDVLSVSTGARHRLGTELRIDGTSLIDGAAGVLSPATQVVIWDTTRPTPVKLGSFPVDTLGAWAARQKPGPTTQVRSVLIQSTRGGTAVATLST
ncbi:PKD domain-containing protein [Nakamurella sp. GG22]